MENNKKGKEIDLPIHRIVFIVVSFALAILDMTLLQEKIQIVFSMSNIFAMVTAFIIATIANFFAFTWGWGNGKRLEKHAINPRSAVEFSLWVVVGFSYIAFRVLPSLHPDWFNIGDDEVSDLRNEILQIVVLAISYIGSGLTIQDSAREIFDRDCVKARKARKVFTELREDLAADSADIRESISILNNYSKNYESLETQKKTTETAIKKGEISTMSDIAARVKAANPEISPAKCEEVMDRILEKERKLD